MRNKFLTIFLMLVICIFTFANVNAETKVNSIMDINTFEEVYKLSEQGEKIEIPFINVFSASATYDEIVKHSGLSIGSSTIDVNEKLEGVQTIISNDMVTIKGEVEHAIIIANNVVIEGKVSGDTLIFSSNVKILEGAKISRDIVIVSNALEIEGQVDGNVIAVVSDNTKISGKIGKDFRGIVGSIDVTDSEIKGNIYAKTDSDTTALLGKYENATIVKLDKDKEASKSSKVLDIIIKGIITVIIYTIVTFFVTKKDGNIVSKATSKFKQHTIYGVIMALVYFLLIVLLPILLIMLGAVGLGIVAWPILIFYLALFLFSISTSSLVVGMVIYESIKSKVGKYKIVSIAGIFAVLFILSNIPVLSYYVLVAINLVSLAVIITMITRKKKQEEKVENK